MRKEGSGRGIPGFQEVCSRIATLSGIADIGCVCESWDKTLLLGVGRGTPEPPVGNTGLHPHLSQQIPRLCEPQGHLGPFGYIFLYFQICSTGDGI